jgi:CHAT domain-containing protein/Tfp pilus assembly protein PilF
MRIFLGTLFLLAFSQASFAQDDWQASYDSSANFFNEGNYEAASQILQRQITNLEKAIPDTNAFYEMNNLLGICYYRLTQIPQAEAAFIKTARFYENWEKATENSLIALQNLGAIYYSQKQYDKSAIYYEKALAVQRALTGEKDKDYISLLNNLANADTYLKKYHAADSVYQKLLELKKEVYGDSSLEYAGTLKNLANLYKNQGKYKEAEPLYLKASVIIRDSLSVNNAEYVNILNNLAGIYKNESRFEEAEQKYVEVLNIRKSKSNVSNEYAGALVNLGQLYKTMSRFTEAEPLFEEALSIYKLNGGDKSQNFIVTQIQLAGLYRNEGQYRKAEDLYIESERLFKETLGENHPDYASLLNNIALLYNETGRYSDAEILYKKVLEATKISLGEKHPEYATSLNNLALLFKDMGQYEKAEPLYLQSMKIRKEVLGASHPEYGASLNNLAALYQSMGRYKQAEPLYNQALEISRKVFGEKHLEFASSLLNLAGLYENMAQYEKSEKLYTQALQTIKSGFGENHPDYAIALNNLALLQQKTRKYESAEQLYKQDLDLTEKTFGNNHPSYATGLSNLAGLYENMGKYAESEKLYLQAIQIRLAVLGDKHPDYAVLCYDLARVNTVLGKLDEAETNWVKALSNYLHQINAYFPSMSEKEKEEFYLTIKDKFEQFNSFAVLRSKTNPAITGMMYNNQLATKALLFNASNKVRERIINSGNPELIELYKSWQAEKELLARLYSLSKDEIKKRNINLDSLEKKANQSEKDLSLKSELFKNSSEKQTFIWQEVQQTLKPEEAAVEMIRFVKYKADSGGTYTDSVYYAGLVISSQTKDKPVLVLLKNGKDLETKYIKYYKNTIRFKVQDDYCYKEYWKRLKDGLSGVRKIYFSPDGVYNQINLISLKDAQTGSFVADEMDIQVVTNSKDLLSFTSSGSNSNKITLFGNADFTLGDPNAAGKLSNLPGTEEEVKKVDQIAKSKGWSEKLYTGKEATEETLKSISEVRVLHVATHGYFEKDIEVTEGEDKNDLDPHSNPLLRSGIMLAGAGITMEKRTNLEAAGLDTKNDDGILSAYEAMNLSLDKTELVVLSACETGLGDVKNGEGVYGLQRAFRVAGARSLIISLWKVNDETTQKLMTAFYEEWLKGKTKREAFKAAQQAIRSQYPDPYYWAAFIMVGE